MSDKSSFSRKEAAEEARVCPATPQSLLSTSLIGIVVLQPTGPREYEAAAEEATLSGRRECSCRGVGSSVQEARH